ncbi:MAG: acetyl-CoA carboxylase, biotin carboxyl carrier protein [Planctomycetes bacterium]|nr:acetyl-CoA carboxylase, biotin carboxyl carrier protein [Planctomycetota bacterium]
MDVREIKKLITLMNENGLARLEVEEEGKRYLLEKAGATQVGPAPLVHLHPGAPAPLAPVGALAAPTAAPPAPEPPKTEDTITFNSPLVGTFFRAASPELEVFVQPGDRVAPDSVVCLIEAMKVFNEVKAEVSGTIVEVLAENGEAVEYNQPLFLIKPS